MSNIIMIIAINLLLATSAWYDLLRTSQYNCCLPMCVYPAKPNNYFLPGHHQGATRADWPWIATNIESHYHWILPDYSVKQDT